MNKDKLISGVTLEREHLEKRYGLIETTRRAIYGFVFAGLWYFLGEQNNIFHIVTIISIGLYLINEILNLNLYAKYLDKHMYKFLEIEIDGSIEEEELKNKIDDIRDAMKSDHDNIIIPYRLKRSKYEKSILTLIIVTFLIGLYVEYVEYFEFFCDIFKSLIFNITIKSSSD